MNLLSEVPVQWSLGYPPEQRSRIESLPLGLAVSSLGCFESSQRPSEFVQKAGKNPAIKVDDFLVQGSRAKKKNGFLFCRMRTLSPVRSKLPLKSCP